MSPGKQLAELEGSPGAAIRDVPVIDANGYADTGKRVGREFALLTRNRQRTTIIISASTEEMEIAVKASKVKG